MLCSKRALLKDDAYYNIQIQKNRTNKHIYLIAQNEADKSTDQGYYIDLPNRQAKYVEKIFKRDYSSIIDSISIQNDKMVLLNPKYVEPPESKTEEL